MNPFRSPFGSFALAAALAGFAPGAARAQTEIAATVQKKLASGTDAQKRLRVDDLTDAGGKLKLTGVYLDAPAAKEGAPTAFEVAQEEVAKVVREVRNSDAAQLDWSGVKKVAEKDHPHVVLQRAANAAGATGAKGADRCLFAASRFGPTGAVVLSGTRGKDEAAAGWVAGAIAEHLAKHPAVRTVSEKPLVTDELKAAEWKLTPADVQKLLSSSTDAATRRLRADRVYLVYDAENPDPAVRFTTLHLTLEGVRLGEDAVNTGGIPDACRKRWPELFTGGPRVLVDLKPLLGPGIPDFAAKLQTAVASKPALDGVRVDAGSEFGADGSLALAGVQPGLSAAAEKELGATYRAVLQEFIDKADAASNRYKRLSESPLSTKKMGPVATKKLLRELRTWAADTMDDARISRVYFGADGALKLEAKTVTRGEGELVRRKFQELSAKLLGPPAPKGDSRSVAPADGLVLIRAMVQPPAAGDPTTFGASLTAHLRKEVAGDQKKWNGVLIERGLFDEDNRFTLRGVVDSAKQNDELAKLLDALRADPKWAAFFEVAPNKPALDVVPLSDLLERVKRVAPAYPEFDGIRIESARYDANVNLIFEATATAAKLDGAAATRLAKLIREHKDYRRRAPADKQVKIVRVGGPVAADTEESGFSVAYGAKLLEGADGKKTRAWLDSALLHYPNESGVWYLSAYYHHMKGDAELVRRDLFRMIALEGPLGPNGAAQRKRRYDAAKNLQGKERNELDALWIEYLREVKDGAKPITLTKEK
ncbi:MAG TPA: hypothetical protein VGE74_04505 [Gemmata sp.]